MSSTKGPWENRVRDLLLPEVAFYHKCADIRSAGRARLDFLAMFKNGKGGIIEVKQAPFRKTKDWNSAAMNATGLSTLQRMEMRHASEKGVPYVVVALGVDNYLFLFDFKIMEEKHGKFESWPYAENYEVYQWTGPKGWDQYVWVNPG